MAEKVPNSYKDPYWSNLATQAEQKVGLPRGLLVSILTEGEKTNADQISSANARTPFQIIPSTRDAIIKKYKIDPYLNPQNSAEGAALLLKESLDRNKGDIGKAAAEYHGGTDPKNWGSITQAYVQRVTKGVERLTGQPQQTQVQPQARQQQPGAGGGQVSTFQRALANVGGGTDAPATNAIANVYQAYQSGRMSPQDAAEFESDVQAGKIMLPRGAAIKGVPAQGSAPTAQELPAAVVQAYSSGKMAPEDRAELERDLASGVIKAPAGMQLTKPVEPETTVSGVTGAITRGMAPVAAGAALGAMAGAPIAGVGAIPGAIAGAGAATIAQVVGDPLVGAVNSLLGTQYSMPTEAMNDLLTRVGVANPKTEAERIIQATAAGAGAGGGLVAAGRAITSAAGTAAPVARGVGQLLATQPAMQIAGGAGAGAAGEAVKEAGGGAGAQLAAGLAGGLAGMGAAAGAGVGASRVARAMRGAEPPVTAPAPAPGVTQPSAPRVGGEAPTVTAGQAAPTPGTMGSVGSAGVDMATQRAAKAGELPVPIELTTGQKTRAFEDVRFERETAKIPEVGEPLRERFAQQNQKLAQNLDAFIDMTGSRAPETEFRRATGMAVDDALRARAAKDKAKIRVLYKEAEKAGEMSDPVNLTPVADYLNNNRAGRSSAPIMQVLAEELKVQNVGTGSLADGTLNIGSLNLKQAESLRKSINRFVNNSDPNDVRVASELKSIIDAQTDGLGGSLYKQARGARARYAADYENIGLVKNLLNFKRGTTDRAIALEDVLNKAVIDPSTSLDTVKQVRRLLQTEGDNGKQAWRELQGGTVQYIKEQALKNVAPDQFGNRIISAAQLDRVISSLDRSGKLDFVFGKKGAEQLRTVNEVAKDVLTVPPGTVNTSNTATVMAGLLDVAITGMSGLPAPVATGYRLLTTNIKNAKTKARVKRVLGQ